MYKVIIDTTTGSTTVAADEVKRLHTKIVVSLLLTLIHSYDNDTSPFI
jgi:hypothetical protein